MWRDLGVFFLLGLLLFGAKQWLALDSERPLLRVEVAAEASDGEREQAIDEAVLIELSLAQGAALHDPIVREQLLSSMRIDTRNLDEADSQLLERALALGIHNVDPVVRQRLAYHGQQLLAARTPPIEPSEEQLTVYRAEHASRYREPPRISFAHVFVSRSRFREGLAAETQARGQRLATENPAPEQAFRYSDPTILPLQIAQASRRDIAARFNDEFATRLAELPEASWQGPVESSFGQHFVFITARTSERLPSVGELRQRLRADFAHDQRRQLIREALRAERRRYQVELHLRAAGEVQERH